MKLYKIQMVMGFAVYGVLRLNAHLTDPKTPVATATVARYWQDLTEIRPFS